MNLIILGIMALCGASLKTLAITAIVLGSIDFIGEVLQNLSERLNEYMDIYKQNQEKEDE